MGEEIRWGGLWESPTNTNIKCGGELFLDQKHGVIRLVIFHLQDNFPDMHATNLFPTEMPLIFGEISNGTKVTLCNCKVVNRHSQNFYRDTITIYANLMFLGKHQKHELKFDRITYELSNIIDWTGLCKYTTDYENGISFKWEHQSSVSVILREGVKIFFTPQIGSHSSSCVNEEFNLTQRIEVIFEYSSPVTLEESLEDVRSLIHLIDLGLEDNVYIKKIQCFRNNYLYENKQPIPIEVYTSFSQDSAYSPQPYYTLFNLQGLLQKEDLLANWFKKYPKLKPIIDLYSSVFSYPQMPIEMTFLNSVQALETYHARFVCDKLSIYKKNVKELLNQVPEAERDQHGKNFLSAAQTNKCVDYIILKSRLCDLFVCNFKYSFSNIYDEKYPYTLIDAIVDTRHYLTHYSAAKEQKALKGKDLESAVIIMRQVLEFYLLEQIGFDLEYIQTVINRRKGSFEIQKRKSEAAITQVGKSI